MTQNGIKNAKNDEKCWRVNQYCQLFTAVYNDSVKIN